MTNAEIVESGTQATIIPKAVLVGAVLGAAVGAAAAYLFVQNADQEEGIRISPGEGIKLGLLVFGLLRSVASLGED